MKLIDGKEISNLIKSEIANEVKALREERGRTPHLAAILVGNDPASETYVANKEKACKEVGMASSVYKMPADISEKELIESIEFINKDEEIDGLIVQLPIPKHISVHKVIESINPKKDVDGFHPINVGRMVLGEACYLPATPYGISMLLERSGIETAGKNCVIVGRSNIVGTPMSILMSRNHDKANATVTLCHSKTKNLPEICRTADILIAAIGKCEMITAEYVKKGATVIDVGMHRVADASKKSGFRLKGDVKFDEVSPLCDFITPVPGGVGPMTIVGLIMNTLKSFKGEVY
ncbi:MAG: bifunctional methylenetetrahydrofolate dehydrogenase/methenyltetrahydrofolate cyclohydrolase FolD [Bacteroidales bacterium]|jgi:methylenetetrahydrofolate dehydrogenase (NADP+)/methenyltetrahydrofolate cyclohydrolase|nr:bifunctional methylenetetrahydrofolate dehydrogenase/methenyltetrahydrofolate cyclohydrolase FolD [Bacteroidales bacterium]MDD2686881.1 bifunctional methylenetetrahydrofolate dehydrogenase/methenyltetrahydrofolate cyclohydrolase FolD [Bacteroidales bacterium]MDD3329713.1 bifunctional methylenetetrahydrofolate dehydrogenase/methenyltetrahydrofolate cyclohydrolase FolD [Bacteroidales bacterium]MDD3690497.1 bifunctional methylenetetrahydrofolate dehydrogenase/methenyltetrahydrofolate cyclohydrol